MTRALARLATVAIAAAVAVPISTGTAMAAHPRPGLPPSVASGTVHGHTDLPADAPAALYRAEPRLPKAKGWPGSDTAFSRTSGTGRLYKGGFYWTDWLYDDHGTTTDSAGDIAVTAGSPSFGTYTYPPGKAHENGADIFRAAVYRGRNASYWRVDFTTLADPRVPIVEWSFDRDDDASTGGYFWPAFAGVHSPGIDTALVVSSRGAALTDATDGSVITPLHTTVSRGSHSFVVKVPNRFLAPKGSWRVRLVAGLSNVAGTGFASPPNALITQPNVYNVTFRDRRQEPVSDDFWDDSAQTGALATGGIGMFSHVLHWSQLKQQVTTPQPRPTGWSDRWYVSDIALAPGITTSPATISDGLPNYLGRVQPYAVYVPKSYRPGRRAPLTFLLHSLTQNHNQYAATTPRFSKLACEQRHSICVTTLGRGPDGNYFDTAELDFWQVWHAVAAAYSLDPNRTVLCGYSMGGIGTNQLAMAHPDLFARGVTLAGAVGDTPALANLRWVPMYLAGGAEDELVPVTVERAEATALQRLGDRFRWLLYPVMDHVAYELADSFTDAARYMGTATRVRNPGSFQFTWVPRNSQDAFSSRALTGGGLSWTQLPRYGVGTTGDYWVRRLQARNTKNMATIAAFSGMRPVRKVIAHPSSGLDVSDGPQPGVATEQTWSRGARPAPRRVIRLRLTNVRSLRILPRAAGFARMHGVTLVITTDGPTRIRIGHRVLNFGKGGVATHFG